MHLTRAAKGLSTQTTAPTNSPSCLLLPRYEEQLQFHPAFELHTAVNTSKPRASVGTLPRAP